MVVRWVCLPRVLVCVVACVWCAGGLRFGVPAPCHSWPWGLVAGPRHSWLGSAAGCRGRSLATPGRGPWAWFPATPGWGPLVVVMGALGALLLGLGVCVCAVWPFGLVWVAWGGSCAVWLPCVCVCVLAVCGWWGVSYLGCLSSSVVMVVFKEEVL